MSSYIRALRPAQWTKNIVVLAAFFFALGDHQSGMNLGISHILKIIAAMILFCITSSAVYLFNDIRDRKSDSLHPEKCRRPIASGEVTPAAAGNISALLAVIAVISSFMVEKELGLVVAAYLLMQVLYTFILKKIALVDVFVISSGFVLRAIAGAVTIAVPISPWLLLCTFLLAMFLGLCKRKHELGIVSDSESFRESLCMYDEKLLDVLIAIISASTIVAYSIYTLSQGTYEKFGSYKIGFTIPFVMFGIFRYLDLVYREQKGGAPERMLLDRVLLIDIVLYASAVLFIFLA